jgi:hypothetical protein
LLGYVHHDRIRGQWVQRFLRPGEATFEGTGALPPATHYLLHPVLSDVIGRSNPSFFQRVDRANIVGYDRPWRDVGGVTGTASAFMYCVLKGDIHGYGSLMRAGAEAPARRALEGAVRQWAHRAVAAETGEGDSVVIVHDDPAALAQTARHIMDEVFRTEGNPRMRIALHFGEVQMLPGTAEAPPTVAGGSGILCATRVEPHVTPGEVWATEEFRSELARRPSLWRTRALAAPGGGERFNVKKEGRGEPDMWVRLYRMES